MSPNTFDPFRMFGKTGHPDGIFDWCNVQHYFYGVSEIQVSLQGPGF